MTASFFIFIFAVIGIVLSIFLFKNNTEEIRKERLLAIKKKVSSLGGEIIQIDEVDRQTFHNSNLYNNPDETYKFYKIKYSIRSKEKVGYGVLILERNSYGPALAAKTKWMWHF